MLINILLLPLFEQFMASLRNKSIIYSLKTFHRIWGFAKSEHSWGKRLFYSSGGKKRSKRCKLSLEIDFIYDFYFLGATKYWDQKYIFFFIKENFLIIKIENVQHSFRNYLLFNMLLLFIYIFYLIINHYEKNNGKKNNYINYVSQNSRGPVFLFSISIDTTTF